MGLPIPNLSSHSPPSPVSAKMALSFPNKLSMVPAANLEEQLQEEDRVWLACGNDI